MLAILFRIDIIWVPVVAIVAALAGFSLRSLQIQKLKKQVSGLEKEMLNSHAEILSLQEEMVRAQSKNSSSQSLVVSMKEVPAAEEKKDLHKEVKSRTTVK
jgi:hypothetical protein